MLRIFLETEGVERCHSLRRVICSGEALPFELQQRFFGLLVEVGQVSTRRLAVGREIKVRAVGDAFEFAELLTTELEAVLDINGALAVVAELLFRGLGSGGSAALAWRRRLGGGGSVSSARS